MTSSVKHKPPVPKKGILKASPSTNSTSPSVSASLSTTPAAATALTDSLEGPYTPAQRRAAVEQARYIQQQLRPAVPLEVFELLTRFPLHRSSPPPSSTSTSTSASATSPPSSSPSVSSGGAAAQQQQQASKTPPAAAAAAAAAAASDPPTQISSPEQPLALTSAGRPHPDDARAFRAALEGSGDSPDPVISASPGFEARDYDDLVEERNCLGACGYALCARPRRTYGGEFKLRWSELGGGGGGRGRDRGGSNHVYKNNKNNNNTSNSKNTPAGIANVADLNKWCSDDCARRALYVRLQLDDPNYVRDAVGRLVVRIDLMVDEDGKEGGGRIGEAAARRQMPSGSSSTTTTSTSSSGARKTWRRETAVSQDVIALSKATEALALERGTKASSPAMEKTVVIHEKNTTEPAQAPDPKQLAHGPEQSHMVVEGHKIKFRTVPGLGDDDSDDSD